MTAFRLCSHAVHRPTDPGRYGRETRRNLGPIQKSAARFAIWQLVVILKLEGSTPGIFGNLVVGSSMRSSPGWCSPRARSCQPGPACGGEKASNEAICHNGGDLPTVGAEEPSKRSQFWQSSVGDGHSGRPHSSSRLSTWRDGTELHDGKPSERSQRVGAIVPKMRDRAHHQKGRASQISRDHRGLLFVAVRPILSRCKGCGTFKAVSSQ
jgi:hypothetical protein